MMTHGELETLAKGLGYASVDAMYARANKEARDLTFVDASKVRHKRDPGRCYIRAGFKHVGYTKGGLLAFQMLPDQMPEAIAARSEVLENVSRQLEMFA